MTETIVQTKADAILSNVEYGYKGKQKYPTHFEQYHIDHNFKIRSGIEAFGYTVPWKIHGWFCIRRDVVQKYYNIAEASSSPCKHFFDEYLARLMYLNVIHLLYVAHATNIVWTKDLLHVLCP